MKEKLLKLKDIPPGVSWALASLGAAVLVGVTLYGARSLNSLNDERIIALERLESAEARNLDLIYEIRAQQEIIDSFQSQIKDIGTTVGNLEKLSKTDEELLQKYSKVYFLNENYRPDKLSLIDKEYLYLKSEAYFHTQAMPFLENILEEAREDGIELLVASAFRSFEEQASLKNGYVFTYGAGTANQFSADQGYSEHQLGTSVDFTTPAVGGAFTKFEADPAYKWLLENGYKYGFILSYPKGNTYYKFEPWHWRFVGTDLARRLYLEKENFYDLGQREIDAYLIKIFD